MKTVRELEQFLFSVFPAEDATPGDRIGLLVGDDEAEITKIAVALDANIVSIEAAAALGCNVLVTHHPVFWRPPTEFLRVGSAAGMAIYRAAELQVSLIAMHTNLDTAPVARNMLLEPVGFTYSEPLSLPHESDEELGNIHWHPKSLKEKLAEAFLQVPSLGQLAVSKEETEPVSLSELAARYTKTFDAVAQVWGEPDTPISLLAACSGGGGSLVQRVIAAGADCYVTGELAYHEALELSVAGVALIELGHDRSELPYRFYLRDAIQQAGFEAAQIPVLGPVASWWH